MSESPNFDESLLSGYLDGELTEKENTEVKDRLAQDPSLRKILDDLSSLRTYMRSLADAETPTSTLIQGEWSKQPESEEVVHRGIQSSGFSKRSLFALAALAASMIVTATGLFLLPQQRKLHSPDDTRLAASIDENVAKELLPKSVVDSIPVVRLQAKKIPSNSTSREENGRFGFGEAKKDEPQLPLQDSIQDQRDKWAANKSMEFVVRESEIPNVLAQMQLAVVATAEKPLALSEATSLGLSRRLDEPESLEKQIAGIAPPALSLPAASGPIALRGAGGSIDEMGVAAIDDKAKNAPEMSIVNQQLHEGKLDQAIQLRPPTLENPMNDSIESELRSPMVRLIIEVIE